MSYDKSYSDTLYKYDDRDRNNIIDDEVKLPVYEKVTLKFQKGFLSSGIVALIVLLVILTLLKILFHGSSSMSSFLRVYGYAFMIIFVYTIGTSNKSDFKGTIGSKTNSKDFKIFVIRTEKTHSGDVVEELKYQQSRFQKISPVFFSFWMMIYGAIMVMIAEGVISF